MNAPETPESSDNLLDSLVEKLSQREQEVLRLIGGGYSNREIADRLYLTEGIVKNHVTQVLSKLQLRERATLSRRLSYPSCPLGQAEFTLID
jgi:DNA-binding NarL/FixJ family response regulator